MADKEYVERGALLHEIDNREPIIWSGSGAESQAAFDRGFYRGLAVAAPTADAVEVRHGEWEFIGNGYANCTNCGTIFETLPTKYVFERNNLYCRHCGAKMDGKGEGE